MKLKILSYNILHGFHTPNPAGFKLEKKRLEAVKRIIKQEKPDILGINEACFGAPNEFPIRIDYKKLFGFKHSVRSTHHWEWGNALLSQIPIEDPYTIAKEFSNAIGGKIGKLNLAFIHPRYNATDHEKIKFVRPILEDIKKPFLLFGDHNALSDDDDYNQKEMYKAFKHFAGNNYKKSVDNLLDRQLIPFIKSYGLKDVLLSQKTQEPTIPTASIKHPTENAPIRLDYFFASKDIKVKSASTIKNKWSDIGSDHYPIVCEIEV